MLVKYEQIRLMCKTLEKFLRFFFFFFKVLRFSIILTIIRNFEFGIINM